jgi:hypothetical protein
MSGARVFGRASRRSERDVRANEHGAARLRYEGGHRTAPRGVARCSSRWEATTYECSSWNGFGVQKSIGRIAGRDARGSYQAHLGYARPSRKESHARRLTRRAARRSGDNGAQTFEAPSNHGDATLVSSCARKPRRDRIRRGAGSGTREVPGPRARGDRYDGRVSGSWMHPPKPGMYFAALASRVNAPRASRRAEPLVAQQRKCAHRCPWGDGDTQRSGRFRRLFQPRSPSGGVVRGVGTHGAELHSLRSRRRRCEAAAFALRSHGAVASREACDTRSAPESTSGFGPRWSLIQNCPLRRTSSSDL